MVLALLEIRLPGSRKEINGVLPVRLYQIVINNFPNSKPTKRELRAKEETLTLNKATKKGLFLIRRDSMYISSNSLLYSAKNRIKVGKALYNRRYYFT